jgi:hypothetical protein
MNVRNWGWIVGSALLALWGSRRQRHRASSSPDAASRLCHADSAGTMTLPSGEFLHAQIDPTVLEAVRTWAGKREPVYCTDCHGPAPTLSISTRAERCL